MLMNRADSIVRLLWLARWPSFVTLWLAAVMLGLWRLETFEQIPCPIRPPPPAAAVGVESTPGRFTLVMAVHPKCPCSRAGVEELARIVHEAHGLIECRVLVYVPRGAAEDWTRTSSVEALAAIPGVKLERDVDGLRALALGAETSGSSVLYDDKGQARFWGGLTSGRGVAGAAIGGRHILDLVSGAPGVHTAPVYGCPIIDTVGEEAEVVDPALRGPGCPLCEGGS